METQVVVGIGASGPCSMRLRSSQITTILCIIEAAVVSLIGPCSYRVPLTTFLV